MADVGAQPLGAKIGTPGAIFHVGDGAWRIHGLCADHLLHHGLWLFRRGHCAQPPAAGTDLGMGRVLDGDPRRSPCSHFDRLRPGLGAVHVLPAAYGKRLVLHRAGAGGCGIVGLVRADAGRDACMETSTTPADPFRSRCSRPWPMRSCGSGRPSAWPPSSCFRSSLRRSGSCKPSMSACRARCFHGRCMRSSISG